MGTMEQAAPTAVVTGATGFVASELVKQLLEKGYTVRGTVRSLHNESKVQHLQRLGKALPGKLTLHEADLLKEGSFDTIVEGATYLFHTASPFFIETSNPQEDLIDPALKGTANVMQAAAKAKPQVKRIILTSSVAAVHGEYAASPKNGHLYTEEDWNETSTIDNQPYHRSKVVAEQEAWKFAKSSGLDFVTILPNFVLGPVLSSRADGTSVGFLKGIAEGTPAQGTPLICDVRDVARAHVLAAENPRAAGRYIVSHRAPLTASALSKALQERFPQFAIPDVPEQEYDTKEKIDNSKAEKELGLQLMPAVTTFIDGIVTLVQLGIAQPLPSGAPEEGTPAV
ncbi:g3958 [Coccomyxa viridis]|uniref:Flavanone 4-reductase n=1 Tax=Coccomyxa viridis TaxID=1274662 RepID=A0ABP1FP53_9CHLO